MKKGPSAHERLAELYAKLDGFFARACAMAPGPQGIGCGPGCADCCRAFSITEVEADFIARAIAGLPATERLALERAVANQAEPDGPRGVGALAEIARPRGDRRCPALAPDARCLVYSWRPAICRTHGLALRVEREPEPSPTSPEAPAVVCCARNFQGRDLATLDPALVLDQQTLSTMLGAIDALYAREQGRPWQARRVELERTLQFPTPRAAAWQPEETAEAGEEDPR